MLTIVRTLSSLQLHLYARRQPLKPFKKHFCHKQDKQPHFHSQSKDSLHLKIISQTLAGELSNKPSWHMDAQLNVVKSLQWKNML